jgi:hypothetical protein
MVLLLSMLATSALVLVRQQTTVTHRDASLARAAAAADATLVFAMARLSDTQSARHPAIGGDPQPWSFDGIATTYLVTEEDGRIDLNEADPWLLYGYLRSKEISDTKASALIESLRKTGTGALSSESDLAPAPQLRTPEELERRPGWNRPELRCWLRDLTVYSGLPDVSVVHATSGTRGALQWAEDHRLGDRSWLAADSGGQSFTTVHSIIGDVLRIEVTAREGEVSVAREWVGRLTGDAAHPALTIRWDDRMDGCVTSD